MAAVAAADQACPAERTGEGWNEACSGLPKGAARAKDVEERVAVEGVAADDDTSEREGERQKREQGRRNFVRSSSPLEIGLI